MTETGVWYTFIIMNGYKPQQKKGTHWWSFLDLHPKKEIFLFDSLKVWRLQTIYLQNNRKTLNKILYRIKRFEKRDNKVTTITLTFSMKEYEKIKKANRPNTTTQGLLHLMNKFVLVITWCQVQLMINLKSDN